MAASVDCHDDEDDDQQRDDDQGRGDRDRLPAGKDLFRLPGLCREVRELRTVEGGDCAGGTAHIETGLACDFLYFFALEQLEHGVAIGVGRAGVLLKGGVKGGLRRSVYFLGAGGWSCCNEREE